MKLTYPEMDILAPKMYILTLKMYILTPKMYILLIKLNMYLLAHEMDKSVYLLKRYSPSDNFCTFFSESVRGCSNRNIHKMTAIKIKLVSTIPHDGGIDAFFQVSVLEWITYVKSSRGIITLMIECQPLEEGLSSFNINST